MKEIRVRATFLEPMLGTASANKELHAEFIASKSPDAMSREEEVAALGVEAVEEKAMTIFPKLEDGTPFIYDYQIKGFFKDSCKALQRCKGEKFSKASCAIKAYKQVIDGCIFVFPRMIPIDMHGGEIGDLQRPLRASTAQGERIALARSETIPAGSTIEFTIRCLSDDFVPAVKEWLDYGKLRGLGCWRNASWGRFSYEIVKDDKDETATA